VKLVARAGRKNAEKSELPWLLFASLKSSLGLSSIPLKLLPPKLLLRNTTARVVEAFGAFCFAPAGFFFSLLSEEAEGASVLSAEKKELCFREKLTSYMLYVLGVCVCVCVCVCV